MEKIQFGKFVSLAYEIFTTGADGDMSVFKFTAEHPDNFVFGMEPGMLESFMRRIEGLEPGAEFDFTLTPAEAFGEVNPEMVIEIDKSVASSTASVCLWGLWCRCRLRMATAWTVLFSRLPTTR